MKDAPEVDIRTRKEPDRRIGQPDGVADSVPYLYFTVVALDGIQDLFSDRTLTLGLLTPEQQTARRGARLRWEITQQYWSGIARFDADRWPLEDIPWRTTGQRLESDYFSLSVAAIVVHDLVRRRATDDDLTRTVAVMERLAERGRITSRMTGDDPAVQLHNPGVTLPLQGSDSVGPAAALDDDRLLRSAAQTDHPALRVVPQHHLARPAVTARRGHPRPPLAATHPGGRGRRSLGQRARGVSRSHRRTGPAVLEHHRARHRVHGRRAPALRDAPPIRSPELTVMARALLSESTHLFGFEQMEPSTRRGRRATG